MKQSKTSAAAKGSANKNELVVIQRSCFSVCKNFWSVCDDGNLTARADVYKNALFMGNRT